MHRKHFFKKYGFSILFFGLFAILLIFLIPGQENHYPEQQIRSISERILYFSVILLLLAGSVFWIYHINKNKSVPEALLSLAAILFYCAWAGFFFLNPVLKFSGLLLNRMWEKKTIVRQYSFSPGNSVMSAPYLYDESTHKGFFFSHLSGAEKLPGSDGLYWVDMKASVGLLGWEFDPVVVSARPLDAPEGSRR